MTTKELAEFTGKNERTLQRWIKSAGDKMSSISDKMSSSNSTYPADFSLDEVEQILLFREKNIDKLSH